MCPKRSRSGSRRRRPARRLPHQRARPGVLPYTYQVGSPGPGATAPDFTLPSNMRGTFDLGAQRGKTVLLLFQEGTDCQPCWTQLQAIQANMAAFRRAGIDEVVSITTDPFGALRQAASTYGTTIPVLSDPTLAVSRSYHANDYGMMGTSADGHSFIVVGPSGRIEWRADYGGAPNYTMYVPAPTLLHQMQAGMAQAGRP
ncbi:MAG: peroxiredoxin family protein [Acidimicrobiales bacterium]